MTVKKADICWGQRSHWLRYQKVPADARHDAHIVVNVPLPDGVSLAQLQSTLDYLVRRHEILRTVYDAGALPWPQQQVLPATHLPVRLTSVESDGTLGPAQTIAELNMAEFDLAREWPIRACAVTSAGQAKRLVVILNHVAFDDWSLDIFRKEFEVVLAATISRGRAALVPVAHQPTDLARAEGSGKNTAVLDYWRPEVTGLPADLLARRRAVGGPATAFSASLTSPALLDSARELAARHRIWPSAVQLAAYAVTMAAYSGEKVIAFRWLTSHRQAAEHMSVISCMVSPTLVALDLSDDPPFSEVLRRTAARVQAAQANGYVAYDEIVELLARESFRRGQVIRVESDLNFLSYPGRSCGARRDRFKPNPVPAAWARAGSDLYLRIQEWADGVTIGLQVQSSIMSDESAERFLRGWVRLVQAHLDDSLDLSVSQAADLSGFSAAPRDISHLGQDAIDLEQTEHMLTSHPAVRTAAVSIQGCELVAQVVSDLQLTPAQLRLFCFGQLYERAAVRCPDRFEIDFAGGLVTGDGRDLAELTADDLAADSHTGGNRALVLAKVVAELNDLDEVRLTDCYVVAGGRVLRAPKVLSVLAELGWSGLALEGLCGALPLATLARSMTPLD